MDSALLDEQVQFGATLVVASLWERIDNALSSFCVESFDI